MEPTQTNQNGNTPNQTTPDVEHAEGIVVEPGMIAQIERANIDVQIETAHRFPQHTTALQIASFRQRLMDMATADEETAISCIYNKPVGEDPESGRQKYATGPSVRLAEMGATNYGNLRYGAQVVEMNPRYVKVRGMAHDLETNLAATCEVVEATVYGKRSKRAGQPYSESQRIVVTKAALAKARRDAINMIIRPYLTPVIQRIKQTISGKKAPLEQRRAGVSDWLAKIKPFEPERVYAAFGKTSIEEMGHEELDELRIILASIQQGETSLDEAFPPIETQAPAPEGDKTTLEGRLGQKKPKSKPKVEETPKTDPGAIQTPPEPKATK